MKLACAGYHVTILLLSSTSVYPAVLGPVAVTYRSNSIPCRTHGIKKVGTVHEVALRHLLERSYTLDEPEYTTAWMLIVPLVQATVFPVPATLVPSYDKNAVVTGP
jgi:hypothetical protein